MKLFKRTVLLICFIFVVQRACPVSAADYIPWDELSEDSWIDFFDGNDPNMYPVNAQEANDIDPNYPIAFSQAGGGNKAKGMNALKFIHGGQIEGHMVSTDLAGNFDVKHNGDNNVFTTILLVVAIDTDPCSLGSGFKMSLGMRGQQPCQLDPNHFSYYDNMFGRPSGYYSVTDPNGEALTYAFGTGLVTVYGIEGMSSLGPGESITIDYSFNYLPGPVVFSVYGFIGTDPLPTIYHTNKAFIDQNDLGGAKNKISTFAVTIKGDLNGDLKVDFADFAIMSENWLVGAR